MSAQRVYLNRKEAADYLTMIGVKTAERTLAKFACIGGGPVYRRVGRQALYVEKDLTDWVAGKEVLVSAPAKDQKVVANA